MSQLVLLGLAALALPAAGQSTWFVDVHGTPPGTGTSADPYTSIQYAHDQVAVAAGDTLLVRPGTYLENVAFAGKGLAIRSTDGPLLTTLQPAAASGVALQVRSYDQSFEGFTIRGGQGGVTVRITEGELADCIVRDNPVGIAIQGESDALITRCTVVGNHIGIFTHPFTGAAHVRNSIVWGNVADFSQGPGTGSVSFCAGLANLPATWTQGNNVHGDPGLWDLPQRDVHLRPGSPCIGAGRLGVDIGALRYDATHAPTTPTVYCLAQAHSQGCVAALAASGAPSSSGGAFDITCDNVINNQAGFLYYGHAGNQVAHAWGWQCVRAPFRRTLPQRTGGNPPPGDCSGALRFDFGAWIASGSDPSLTAGTAVFTQYWYRDPGAATPWKTGRSAGLAFVIGP